MAMKVSFPYADAVAFQVLEVFDRSLGDLVVRVQVGVVEVDVTLSDVVSERMDLDEA